MAQNKPSGYVPPIEFEMVHAQGMRCWLCPWCGKLGSLQLSINHWC